MSRKLTHHGQNDISLTGNAPGILRLNNTRIDVEKVLGKQQIRAVKGEEHLSSGGKDRLRVNNECETPTVIPGIIRLNGSERERLTNGQRNKTKDFKPRIDSAHKVPPVRKNVLHEDETRRDHTLSLSPARSFVSKRYPIWFDDAQIKEFSLELRQLYDKLIGIMQQNAVLQKKSLISKFQHWAYVMETLKRLQHHFKNIVLQHLKLCCEMKCDNFFWKLLYYNLREYLIYAEGTQTNECLMELIANGIAFYKDLIGCIKNKYLAGTEKSQKLEKFEFIATFVAQKLLICLGDLYRYKAKQLQSNDFNEAAKNYREAQMLIPTNGIPYNQLAIVALHDRKKFEAVYLHMRSLMSSNSIQSARESLLVLFDEMRKKFESTEQKVSPVHQYKNTSSSSSSNSKVISPLRKEVWIHTDGVRRLHRTNVRSRQKLTKPAKNIEQRLDEMPVEDLLRRFISIYLYVIGKLYTGIGMETIQAHQIKLLTQLNALLQREGILLPIARSKVLKIVALNIFILHYNMQQDSRREKRYYTFTFCNQMFGIVLQKCNQLLTNLRASDELREENETESLRDLNTLLQFIKIYTDYLRLNVDIWEPTRNEEQYFIDPWIELQTLFEHIECILAEYKINFEAIPQQEREFLLEENYFFYGFIALPTIQSKQFLIKRTSSEMSQFFARIAHIKEFQSCYTEHMDRLQIEENDTDLSFVIEDLNTDIKIALETLNNETEIETTDVELENKSVMNFPRNKSLNDLKSVQEGNGRNGDALAHLTKLKKELEHQTNAKLLYNVKLEGILKYVDTKVYIEVRPKYLLPDTNCFIDCLDDFEKLLQNFKRYTLVIPLTVVRELDGLSKGIKSDLRPHSMQKHRIHHFDDVSTMAKKSLDFIKNSKQNVKCVTTKGSIINASLFALVEEEYMSNDDKILATAVALSKTMCRETSKDEKCFIQTELVLITTDRNLRVKALSRNLAVSELGEFLLWAQESNHV